MAKWLVRSLEELLKQLYGVHSDSFSELTEFDKAHFSRPLLDLGHKRLRSLAKDARKNLLFDCAIFTKLPKKLSKEFRL